MADAKYSTESLKCWNEAKEIRMDYYKNYFEDHDKGGLRWAGGAWTFDAIPLGLGEDVHPITSEPYGASIAFDKDLAMRCMEAVEKAGYARDLCAYMRNYWGSIILNENAFNYKDSGVVTKLSFPNLIFYGKIIYVVHMQIGTR